MNDNQINDIYIYIIFKPYYLHLSKYSFVIDHDPFACYHVWKTFHLFDKPQSCSHVGDISRRKFLT